MLREPRGVREHAAGKGLDNRRSRRVLRRNPNRLELNERLGRATRGDALRRHAGRARLLRG
eukprot:8789269-Lingulodinium_polyedra.AAC.1